MGKRHLVLDVDGVLVNSIKSYGNAISSLIRERTGYWVSGEWFENYKYIIKENDDFLALEKLTGSPVTEEEFLPLVDYDLEQCILTRKDVADLLGCYHLVSVYTGRPQHEWGKSLRRHGWKISFSMCHQKPSGSPLVSLFEMGGCVPILFVGNNPCDRESAVLARAELPRRSDIWYYNYNHSRCRLYVDLMIISKIDEEF